MAPGSPGAARERVDSTPGSAPKGVQGHELRSGMPGAADEAEEVQAWPHCALDWRGIDVAMHVWLTPVLRDQSGAQGADNGPHSRSAVAQRLT